MGDAEKKMETTAPKKKKERDKKGKKKRGKAKTVKEKQENFKGPPSKTVR